MIAWTPAGKRDCLVFSPSRLMQWTLDNVYNALQVRKSSKVRILLIGREKKRDQLSWINSGSETRLFYEIRP
ncbi:hypothetical protein [Thiolapillus sp.]|uniref:hypothetical protein n=1 Tax=Thiolapillus sp. TaxID=2017437 RepID=UPI0025EB4336|nr:hypothetical protein [Thiolapillus sp.]